MAKSTPLMPTSVEHLESPAVAPTKRPAAGRRVAPFAMLLALLLEVGLFSALLPGEFATAANFRTTLGTQAVLGILTLGMMMPLIAGEFDVSLAMVFTTSMVVAAHLEANQGWPLWLAALTAVVVATSIGALSGAIVVITRADSLVVTLGMLTVLRGLTEAITEGDTTTVAGASGDLLRNVSNPAPLGVPLPVYYLAFVAGVVWYVTEQTTLGRYWHAVGGSVEGARLTGLRVDRLRIGAFALGGLLAGLAGLLQLAKSATAGANFGAGFLFPALSAAFLGAAGFRLGAFNVRGAITAILLLAVGVTGIRMSGAPLWIDEVFNGAALVVAVATVRLIRGREL
jgi:ribose transport system permease protein